MIPQAMAAADAAYDAGRFDEAARRYARVAAFGPAHPLILFNMAAARRDAGDMAGAAPWFRRVTVVAPDLAQPRRDAGAAAFALGRPVEAAEQFRHAAALEPADPAARRGWADAVKSTGDFARGVGIYHHALALAPDDGLAQFNLAVTEADRFHHDAAITAYRRAVVLTPQNVNIHFNLAHELLLSGRLAEGFAAYEHRFDGIIERPTHRLPWWNGEPLAGRRVLLFAEQGHGDGIQFSRYASLVAQAGAAVVGVESPPALSRLMAMVPGITRVHPLGGAPVGDYDLFCPLMSLPRLFGTTLATVPAAAPYVTAPDVKGPSAQQVGLEPAEGGLRVGLAWSGDVRRHDRRQFEANQRRRVPLADLFAALEPLGNSLGVRLVSLQLGEGRAEIAAAGLAGRIVDPMNGVTDFADTAAIIAELDVVVSVCTAVAHLAGAMGCPVLIPLSTRACWRWMRDRDDSPWYPTARLFRQRRDGDWKPVLDHIVEALRGFAIPNGRRRW